MKRSLRGATATKQSPILRLLHFARKDIVIAMTFCRSFLTQHDLDSLKGLEYLHELADVPRLEPWYLVQQDTTLADDENGPVAALAIFT